ncbi:MAG: tRNA dihydrouridine synthase DusB [Clostridia bacterium]|nr:tRNA dihydrouridine synthase DusB [Clostridia bacterium]
MKIKNLTINAKCGLAPMAGYSDRAFRELCINFGAGFAVTEMVSTKAIIYDDRKTFALMDKSDVGFPQGVQLFGSEPEDFEKAISKILPLSFDFIDINMGCPVPKIVSSGAGSALMKTPKKCYDIVKSATKAAGDVPVTVKIRKGWSDNSVNAVEVSKYCQDAGADAIFIHGRTKEQMYGGYVDLDIIKAVKQSVDIPVIGNGDIKNAKDAAAMLENTGCDCVLAARGALGNPFIFREIDVYTKTDALIPKPGISEILYTMLKHIKTMCEYKGEKIGMKEARKHICFYIKGIRYSAKFRQKACFLESFKDLEKLTFEIYKSSV